MGDATGSIPARSPIPADNSSKEDPISQDNCQACSQFKPVQDGPLGISKDMWARVLLWLLPIVFTSGVLFVNIRNMGSEVEVNESRIQSFSEKQNKMHTEQQVQATKLDALNKVQAEMKAKVESVDGKLDDQKDDLALIKARLRIRNQNSSD